MLILQWLHETYAQTVCALNEVSCVFGVLALWACDVGGVEVPTGGLVVVDEIGGVVADVV